MKIAVVASEAAPFVKTGGLGDVMQALPLALSQQKNTYVSLFIPYYSQIKYSGKWQTEFLGAFDVPLAWRREYVGIFRLKTRRKKLQIYFIDNEHYFNRGGVYGFADDGERYAYFSKAVLAAMNYLELQPDVVSCHDWQAALIPLLLKTEYRGCFPDAKSVFTIHNIEYQGKCNLQFNYDVLGLGAGCDEILRFDDCTNFMKSAIVTADRVTTVSETYAQELRYPYYSHGLDGVLQSRGSDFSGITNGIDMQVFDPAKIENIAQNFTAKTLREGKIANKLALQQRVGLPEDRDVAVLAMVTRLVGHKGIDLLCYIAERLIQRRIQLVIIGTGEEKYEWYLNTLRDRFGDKVSVNLLFDGGLANLVYAATCISCRRNPSHAACRSSLPCAWAPSRSSTQQADSRIRSGRITKRMRRGAALPSRATMRTISSPPLTARLRCTIMSPKNGCASPKMIWRSIPAGTFRRRNTWRCSRTSADSKRP